eukprot:1007660-Lingulodinium_polyedra.AAC.1
MYVQPQPKDNLQMSSTAAKRPTRYPNSAITQQTRATGPERNATQRCARIDRPRPHRLAHRTI